MTTATMDTAPSCQVGVPGVMPLAPGRSRAPGWYLIAANNRAEAGPFATEAEARAGARWLDDHVLGVNPAPWLPVYSAKGLVIGSRVKPVRADPGHSAR